MQEPIETLISQMDVLSQPLNSNKGLPWSNSFYNLNKLAPSTISYNPVPTLKNGRKNRALTAHIKGGIA
jgi:hypothetical protein